MSFKLSVKERIPIVIYMGKDRFLFEMQISTLKPNGEFRGYFLKYSCMDKKVSCNQLGMYFLKLLEDYHVYGDLTQSEVHELTGMSREEHNELEEIKELEYARVKNLDQLYHQYLRCSVRYLVYEKKYRVTLSLLYHRGRDYNYEACPSTGKENLLTFDTPLEFDASISPEALGEMILEAFDRCQQLADASEGKSYEVKK